MIDADIVYYDPAAGKTVIISETGRHGFFIGTPIKWLDQMCIAHGSTYKGRVDAFRTLTDTVQKPAVLISEMTHQIFFPTVSSTSDDCVWLCADRIFSIHAKDAQHSLVLFMDGNKIELAVSRRTLMKQMKRCEMFLEKMRSEIERLQTNGNN